MRILGVVPARKVCVTRSTVRVTSLADIVQNGVNVSIAIIDLVMFLYNVHTLFLVCLRIFHSCFLSLESLSPTASKTHSSDICTW